MSSTDTGQAQSGVAFELTELQQAYDIGRRAGLELAGVSPLCYLEFACGDVEVGRLRQAVRMLAQRHGMVRAELTEDGRQRIPERERFDGDNDVLVEDLSGLTASEQEARLARLRDEFQAGDEQHAGQLGPPMRLALSRLGPQDCRLHVAVEMLFLDLPSVLRALGELRQRLDGARPPVGGPGFDRLLKRQPLSGDDGVNNNLDPERRAAREYWQQRIENLPGRPELPLAVAPEQLGRPRFVAHRAEIGAATWGRLRAQARKRGLRPSVLPLFAYAEVIRAWSKTADFTLTVTRDTKPEHSGSVLGQFAMPSLLEVRGTAERTVAERLAEIARRIDQDAEHAEFSGLEVLRELGRRTGTGRVSMPVVHTSTLDADLPDGIGMLGELVGITTRTPQVWLENQVVRHRGGLLVNWNAVEKLFPPGVVEAMLAAYERLLVRLADDESVWHLTGSVVDLPEQDAAERERANDTAGPIPPARLHDLVAEAAERTPEAVAVIASGGSVTHAELAGRAYRIAARIRDRITPGPGELVAVTLPAGVDQLAAILGVLHAGAAYVCIDPSLPAQRRDGLLRRCHVRCLLTDSVTASELGTPELAIPELVVIALDGIALDGPAPRDETDTGTRTHTRTAPPSRAARPTSPQTPDDLAYVIFTSGSTGEPKGVMISHRSAANTVRDINQRFGVGPEDRVLSLAPTGFDLSVYDIFGVLAAGGAVVIPEPARASDTKHWTELVRRHRVSIWNTVPAPVRLWIDQLDESGEHAGDSLRLVLMSGDWIPVELPDRIRRHFPDAALISLGGATEGSIWSIHHPIGEVPPAWVSIPYGKPLTNQTMHVLGPWQQPSPTWVTGEIHIGGVGVAQGYWEDPERTAERFITHPVTGERLYRTGDLGRYLPGGDIEILGREDHQVKINGYRVELGEIEACLDAVPGVRQALVTAPRHPSTGQRQLVAYLVPDETPDGTGPAYDIDAVREACVKSLPGFMVPGRYLRIDAVPLTPNGKIDRSALPTPWTDDDDGVAERADPADELEQRVAEVWARQLGHQDFGVTDGFFDIGGDSLHAVGILREVREQFGLGADSEQRLIESLFLNADVSSFAEVVRQGAA